MTIFPLKICLPEHDDLYMDVTQISVRTYGGALGMMAKHEPVLLACPQGIIRIQKEGGAWERYESDPFIVSSDGTTVTILSSSVNVV
jgi:F0F1-type ATP synthase epsilon subunit